MLIILMIQHLMQLHKQNLKIVRHLKIAEQINDPFADYVDFINITMLMQNLIEYSGNYSDTSGSLLGFKRDDIVKNAEVTNDNNAPSFKYKVFAIQKTMEPKVE